MAMPVSQAGQKIQKSGKGSLLIIYRLKAWNILDENILRPISLNEAMKFTQQIFPCFLAISDASMRREWLTGGTRPEKHRRTGSYVVGNVLYLQTTNIAPYEGRSREVGAIGLC